MSDPKYCLGCRDDFYNGNNDIGVERCWNLDSAKVVTRYRVGWWTRPDESGAFAKVETHGCHYAPGQYAHYDSLPDFVTTEERERIETEHD